MSKPKDFETALQRLEEISRFCQTKLEEAERKVEILNKKADGTLERSTFEEPDSNPGSHD